MRHWRGESERANAVGVEAQNGYAACRLMPGGLLPRRREENILVLIQC